VRQTLGTFMVYGQPDPDFFKAAAGAPSRSWLSYDSAARLDARHGRQHVVHAAAARDHEQRGSRERCAIQRISLEDLIVSVVTPRTL
jgi:hypothetical protein